jgi:excisionase family DNA binding protein
MTRVPLAFSLRQSAQRANVSLNTIRRLLDDGVLDDVRIRSRRLVLRSSLERLLRKGTTMFADTVPFITTRSSEDQDTPYNDKVAALEAKLIDLVKAFTSAANKAHNQSLPADEYRKFAGEVQAIVAELDAALKDGSVSCNERPCRDSGTAKPG